MLLNTTGSSKFDDNNRFVELHTSKDIKIGDLAPKLLEKLIFIGEKIVITINSKSIIVFDFIIYISKILFIYSRRKDK